MSVEYDFYQEDTDSLSTVSGLVRDLLNKEPQTCADNGSFYFNSQWFSLSVAKAEKDDEDKLGSNYGLKPTYRLGFRINSRQIDAEKKMVWLINKIVSVKSSDFVLEFNGEFPVIIRKDGVVKINHQYDDGSNFPFDELTMDVEVIRMPCQ